MQEGKKNFRNFQCNRSGRMPMSTGYVMNLIVHTYGTGSLISQNTIFSFFPLIHVTAVKTRCLIIITIDHCGNMRSFCNALLHKHVEIFCIAARENCSVFITHVSVTFD